MTERKRFLLPSNDWGFQLITIPDMERLSVRAEVFCECFSDGRFKNHLIITSEELAKIADPVPTYEDFERLLKKHIQKNLADIEGTPLDDWENCMFFVEDPLTGLVGVSALLFTVKGGTKTQPQFYLPPHEVSELMNPLPRYSELKRLVIERDEVKSLRCFEEWESVGNSVITFFPTLEEKSNKEI